MQTDTTPTTSTGAGSSPGLPACDYCHAKKIRCDRKHPCNHCTSANVQCLRERPRGLPAVFRNQHAMRLDAMMNRVSRIEQSLSHQIPSPSPSQDEAGSLNSRRSGQLSETVELAVPVSLQNFDEQEVATRRPAKRHCPATGGHRSLSQGTATTVQTATGSQDPQRIEEQGLSLDVMLRLGLADPQAHDSSRRRALLEESIRLAHQTALFDSAAQCLNDDHVSVNLHDPSMYPSIELVALIMTECSRCDASRYYIAFYSNVSLPEFERMSLALLEGSVYGQQRLSYIVCVNWVAYTFLTSWSCAGLSNRLAAKLSRSKKKVTTSLRQAVVHLDGRVRSDLTALVTLLSGAMFMQDIGELQECWKLNTLACGVYESLTKNDAYMLHLLARLPQEEAVVMKKVMLKCYIFDKVLSAHFFKPAHMPSCQLDVSALDSDILSDTMLLIMFEYAKVQEIIICKARNAYHKYSKDSLDFETEPLQTRMKRLKEQTENIRQRHSEASARDSFLKFEWCCLDFMHESILTSIHRVDPKEGENQSMSACLDHSRRCLEVLGHMLDLMMSTKDHMGCHMSTLAWVVPLYPLRAIYFLFSNIVTTFNDQDLELLQTINTKLADLSQNHKSVAAVRNLCGQLIQLYAEYAEQSFHEQNNARVQNTSSYSQASRLLQDEGLGHDRQRWRSPSAMGNVLSISRGDSTIDVVPQAAMPSLFPPHDADLVDLDWGMFFADSIKGESNLDNLPDVEVSNCWLLAASGPERWRRSLGLKFRLTGDLKSVPQAKFVVHPAPHNSEIMVRVAIAGGTGDLGRTFVDVLKQSGNHDVFVLSRKASQSGSVETLAVDYTNVEGLTAMFEAEGIEVVISTLNLFWDGVSQAQLNLIRAAAASKTITKFIPSEYNLDYSLPDDVLNFPPKVHQQEAVRELGKHPDLSWSLVRSGVFLDYMGYPHKPKPSYLLPLWLFLDLDHEIIVVPEDGTQTLVLSHTIDVAYYIERLISLPGKEWPRESAIICNKLQAKDLARIASKATGREFKLVMDPVAKIHGGQGTLLPSNLRAIEGGADADTIIPVVQGAMFATAGNGYDIPGKDLAELFPDVKQTKLEDFLRESWALKQAG